jgi:hypothetical protein
MSVNKMVTMPVWSWAFNANLEEEWRRAYRLAGQGSSQSAAGMAAA